MRKTLYACMAAVLALASLPVLGASAEETTYALGDVDMDGVVTGHDTAMVSRYVLDDTYTLTEEQVKLADVNEDGVVDQADADKLYTEMTEFSFLTPYLFACDVEEIKGITSELTVMGGKATFQA